MADQKIITTFAPLTVLFNLNRVRMKKKKAEKCVKLLISLYRYQVYHCNRYHASAAIGTVRIAANGTMIIGSA